MHSTSRFLSRAVLVAVLGCAAPLFAQPSPDGPPGGGFPGGFPGGPGGPMGGGETKLVAKFDTNGDKRLDATERKAAREHLAKEAANGGGRRRGPGGPGGFGGPGGRGGEQTPPQPGEKLTPADVASYADKPLYDTSVIRTLFLTFESADWEKELADFNNTDVEVPATLVVDGKTYKDVGVHFRGMSSFMMVGEGRKRSLNLSLDFVHEDQRLGDVKTLNLNNAHEDPSFLRQVLFAEIAKNYLPAPRANFVRVVINGESWGLYVNSEQFNKDFTKTHYGSGKGARWKVSGSPNGRGGLAYLGDDSAPYKPIYDIKTKDDETSWAALIRLTKILNETPPDKLEAALAPILDIDGALKFLALENALINNDGYWVRASDYSLYLDEKGKFHLVPHDTNETFARPGGPGFGGGPGGPGGGGRGGNRMMGGPGGFGPGSMLAGLLIDQGDASKDGKLDATEFSAVGAKWFDTINAGKAESLKQPQFVEGLGALLPMPEGFGGPPGGGQGNRPGGPGGFGPAMFLGPGLFTAADADKDGSLTKAEWTATFSGWFAKWDTAKSGLLDEAAVGAGFGSALPGPGGPGMMMGGPQVEGVKLDPLVAAKDANKPLLSKLLAVPALKQRYLGYMHDIASHWLDWQKLGPIAERYHKLIDAEVKKDTRKLESYEEFEASVSGQLEGRRISLKDFADLRRAYLLNHAEIKQAVENK